MNSNISIKLLLFSVVLLWASAFVAIRAGLHYFSPGGLALFRYLIASVAMAIVYFNRKEKSKIQGKDLGLIILTGVIGIGLYNIALNYGEIKVPSGIASFIVSQSPIITIVLAMIFLQERLNLFAVIGISISVAGVFLIALSSHSPFKMAPSIIDVLIATFACGLYSILQKILLKKYHVIDLTTYAIWSGTAILCFFMPDLKTDLQHISLNGLGIVFYLGLFPAALAYLAWNYVLNHISTSLAVSSLYATPFLATLIGWILLGEIPPFLAIMGGLIALIGVIFVNQSHKFISLQKESYEAIN